MDLALQETFKKWYVIVQYALVFLVPAAFVFLLLMFFVNGFISLETMSVINGVALALSIMFFLGMTVNGIVGICMVDNYEVRSNCGYNWITCLLGSVAFLMCASPRCTFWVFWVAVIVFGLCGLSSIIRTIYVNNMNKLVVESTNDGN